MAEFLIEPLPDGLLSDLVPGMKVARDAYEATTTKAKVIQRSGNFNAMQQCTTLSDTANESSPFVVLMGWINCSDKYLKKYSDLLSGLGYSSVRSVQPKLQAFSLYESPRRAWARDILEFLLATQQLPSRLEVGCLERWQQIMSQTLKYGRFLRACRPVVFWCFSNGGCWVLEQMISLLQEQRYQPVQVALAGLIFDSCPCWMTAKTGTMAVTEGASFAMKQLLTAVLAVYFFVARLLNTNGAQRFWNRMMDETLPVPRLYFYSSTDKLCEVQHLEPLLAHKQKQNLDMTVKKFNDSPHCSHLRKHPQEYTSELQAFLKKVTK